jgi:glycerol-3-phosphate acyltransferase PlsY
VIVLVAVLAAYLLGSIPPGVLIARAKGIDLRTVGSGNIGASNVTRALGRGWGLAAFAFDFGKGLLPAVAGAWLARDGRMGPLTPDAAALLLGGAAFLGHVFPLFLRFRGGKGVATAAGLCCGVAPLALGSALLIWFVVFRVSRFVSLGSICGALAFPVAFIAIEGPAAAFGPRALVTGVAVLLAAAIIVLHRSNIRRLVRGEELRMAPREGVRSRTGRQA